MFCGDLTTSWDPCRRFRQSSIRRYWTCIWGTVHVRERQQWSRAIDILGSVVGSRCQERCDCPL